MTSKLLYKELRLAAHPTFFIFTLLGALVLVPAYPYGVVFLFGCIAPCVTFMYARETNDAFFTALLPVRKRDVVRAKCLLLAAMQLTQLGIAALCALAKGGLYYAAVGKNPVGIEANVAYFGFGLAIYALFNAIFLTQFYKTGYKLGGATILSNIAVGLAIVVMEALSHVPSLAFLDGTGPADLVRQLPILLAGALIYAAGMVLTFRAAAARFEKVDL